MRKLILFALLLCGLGVCHAAAPVCLYQDVLSGPATGGEGGDGIYLSIYGHNFGSSQGTSTVTVNGTPVAQYLVWGSNNDVTGEHDQISVQIASGTTGTGNIVVTTSGGSCSNLTFTVRSGNIWFIGSGIVNDTPGSNCTTIENGTAGGGAGGSGTYGSPWTLTSTNVPVTSGGYSTYRTPYTYYHCIANGDVLVFLDGVNYPYFAGSGEGGALTMDKGGWTSSSFITIQARPGATAILGGTVDSMNGIGSTGDASYTVISGMTLIGQGSNTSALHAWDYFRIVGNTLECPDCYNEAGGGIEAADVRASTYVSGIEALGNNIVNISNNTTALPNGSNKQFHDVYFTGDGWEFAWNRISNTAAYNGFQVNQDSSSGYYNFSIHDNDIADVNGSCINLATIDPSSGYILVYNNILHHCGLARASDGGTDNPHNCIADKRSGTATGAGTVYFYNNTMFDCSSILNTFSGEGESGAIQVNTSQNNVTDNFTNNIIYQPAYTYTSSHNVFFAANGTNGTLAGSNNIFYSAATPSSTTPAATYGTIENPLFVSAADGAWTHYELQSTSPAIAAGSASLYPTLDFAGNTRPSSPTMGALEYGSAPSTVQVTASAAPSPATLEQPVTLTATVAQTGSSVPTGSINFLNGGVSLGQASLDNEGTATLVLSWLSVGSYKAIAAYSGDSKYPAGESGYVPLQVLSTTTASLTASPNPVSAGQTLTLTATLTGDGSVWPTGTVTFLNGSTLLGTATLDSSSVATLSTTSLAPGTYSLTAHYAGDSNFLSSTSAAVLVTVNSQATTTSLAASPNPVATGETLTLTAAVEGSGSTTPAGTVSFLSGSTLLGTATLNSSGVATLSTTSLAAGTYSLTAQYSGNANFLSSTSAAVSVTVNSQATTTVPPYSFNITGSTLSQTVQHGEVAVYTLSVTPALGTTLPAITLTASGLPEGSTATFSPQTIAAGSSATNVTLSIQVPAQSAMLARDRNLNGGLPLVAFGILLLPFGGRIRRSGKRMLRLSCMVLLLVGATSLVGLAGCTAPVSGEFYSQSPQTYTITVTTTSASLSQTTNVTLIVK